MTTEPHWLWHPVRHGRARLQHFWLARHQRSDTTILSQRNVYILPTRAGLMLGVTLTVLLLASINYQLNLGYVLTFLLTGSALIGMHIGHGTLRGLHLQLLTPQPTFAGAVAPIVIALQSMRDAPRYGIGLALSGTDQWHWTDVAGRSVVQVQLQFTAPARGRHDLPTLTAETRFPLGSFRVWTVWRPTSQLLVYPAPEAHPPPLPVSAADTGDDLPVTVVGQGDPDGVRKYRRGDPLKMVLWKKMAKSDSLISRDTQALQQTSLWLDLASCGIAAGGDANLEHKLSRLCAWVLQADRTQQLFGLRLPGLTLAPASGPAHTAACLQALALCQTAH